MEIARAVILALPDGDDRPWSSAGSGPKSLVPVATRPILFRTLDALRAAGIAEAVLMTRPEATLAFRRAVGDGARWTMRISHRVVRGGPGLEGAIGAVEEFAGDQAVVVHQADAVLVPPLHDHLHGFAEDRLDALALMIVSDRLPRASPPIVAGYVLSPRAVSVLRDGRAGADPLVRLQERGGSVRRVAVEGCLACHGGEETLLEANRYALAGLRNEVTDALLEDCEIQGGVVIHPTATLRRTVVRGPAIIGAGCHLVDSYIGPYTSIGADARIEGTEIEHSIVMDGAKLMFVGSRIETSIIGRGASIVRRFDMPSAVRMSIGDGAEVALS